jgi:hypothetical protein
MTRRRYFGHHTTWKAHWNTMLLFDRNVTDITDNIQLAAIYCEVDALTPRLKPGVCALRNSIAALDARWAVRLCGQFTAAGEVHYRTCKDLAWAEDRAAWWRRYRPDLDVKVATRVLGGPWQPATPDDVWMSDDVVPFVHDYLRIAS